MYDGECSSSSLNRAIPFVFFQGQMAKLVTFNRSIRLSSFNPSLPLLPMLRSMPLSRQGAWTPLGVAAVVPSSGGRLLAGGTSAVS
jgi:hypothetical protein